MSGEAYNNVQFKPVEEASLEDMRRLRDDLRGNFDDTAFLAFDLDYVIRAREDLDRRRDQLQQRFDKLTAPLKAFNYWKSADSSEESFRQALADWKKTRA